MGEGNQMINTSSIDQSIFIFHVLLILREFIKICVNFENNITSIGSIRV